MPVAVIALFFGMLLVTAAAASAAATGENADEIGSTSYSHSSAETNRPSTSYQSHLQSILTQNSNLSPRSPTSSSWQSHAVRTVQDATRNFDNAVRMEPALPHAHALMARLCRSALVFDRSISLWEGASDLVQDGIVGMKSAAANGEPLGGQLQWAEQQLAELEQLSALFETERRRTLFANHSYHSLLWHEADGAAPTSNTSNTNTANDPSLQTTKVGTILELTRSKLDVYPTHPQSWFDLATYGVLGLDWRDSSHEFGEGVTNHENRNEFYPSLSEVQSAYRRAQNMSWRSWMAWRSTLLSGGGETRKLACRPDRRGVVRGGRGWAEASGVSHRYRDHDQEDWREDGTVSDESSRDGNENNTDQGPWVGTVTLRNVAVSGDDAVVTPLDRTDCRIYVPHIYVNLAQNVPALAIWEIDPVSDDNKEHGRVSSWNDGDDGDDYDDNFELVGGNAVGAPLPMYDPFDPLGGTDGWDGGGNAVSAPERYGTVIMLAGYATDNFYHVLAETLPSLLLLRPYVREVLIGRGSSSLNGERPVAHPDGVLLPESVPGETDFVDAFIRLLMPELLEAEADDTAGQPSTRSSSLSSSSGRVLRYGRGKNNPRNWHVFPSIVADRLVAAAWDPPPGTATADGVHCLTPPPLLRLLRSEVWRGAGVTDPSKDSEGSDGNGSRGRIVIYCSREGSRTRRLEEEKELLARLEEVVSNSNASAGGGRANLVVYGGSSDLPPDAATTVRLFASAAAVVGVHGAALANAVFASPGCLLVEMGFERLPHAGHYRHLAASLGFCHVPVHVVPHEKSLSAPAVRLRDGGMEDVARAVQDALVEAALGSSSTLTSGGRREEL